MIKDLLKDKRVVLYLKCFVALGILVVIFQILPIASVLKALQNTDLSYIVTAYAILIGTRYLSAHRIKILTDVHEVKISIQKLFEINLITSMYGLIMPGTLAGGAVRWHKLSQISNKPAQSLAAIIYDRLMSMIGFTMGGTIFWIIEHQDQSGYRSGGMLMLATSILLLSYIFAFNRHAGNLILKIIDKLVVAPAYIREKLRKLVSSSMEYRSISEWEHVEIFIFTIVFEAFGILAMYLLALSLDLPITIIQIGWIRSVILLISMVPITFAGIGVRDSGLILLLGIYGVAAPDAVALSFLILLGNFVLALVGGIFELRNTIFSTLSRNGNVHIDTKREL